jgi:hypothetical protein
MPDWHFLWRIPSSFVRGEGSLKKKENSISKISEEVLNLMNSSLPEKEKLLSMLTEVYDQLEELEIVLEASFSDLRIQMNNEELLKLTAPVQKLHKLEKELDRINPTSDEATEHNSSIARALKLEMGF